MRQILLNSQGAIVARMPSPPVQPGCVLVRVRYSLISVGTEIASLRPSQAAPTDAPTLTGYASLAKRYVQVAATNPRKALRKAVGIARSAFKRCCPKPTPPVTSTALDLTWSQASALEFSSAEARFKLLSDESSSGYQTMSNVIAIPEGHVVVIELKGTIENGPIAIGLLEGDESAWLDVRTMESGRIDDRLVIDRHSSRGARVVVANVQSGRKTRLDFGQFRVSLCPRVVDGIPYSEMDAQGWNVGYSAMGEVIAVGSGIDDLAVGDLVACAGAGQANHADFVSVRRQLVCRVPTGCPPETAATTTVGSIALQGVRRAEPALGERIAVLGLGLIGQITVQLLRANGCAVFGMDLDPARVERARKCGLDDGASDLETFQRIVRDRTEGRGVDRVLITAATKSSAVVNQALEVVRRKGVVVLVGDVGLAIDRGPFYRKEIDLLMSTSYGAGRYDPAYEVDGVDYPFSYVRWTINRNMQSYLELAASQRIDVAPLIDKIVSIDDAPSTYAELARGGAGAPLGVIIRYPQATSSGPDAHDAPLIHLRGARPTHAGKVRYALVGAGAFGTGMLLPKLDALRDQFFLRGVVSRNAVQGSNLARSRQLPVLATDLDAALADNEIDLMVIATRHFEHAEQAAKCLRAGKHVFVEKPLALTWQQLDDVIGAYEARRGRQILMVGFNRRFSPSALALKAALGQRRSPLVINYRVNAGYLPLDHWTQLPQGGGRNLGEACHFYDLFRFLAGAAAETVSASAIDPGTLPYRRTDNFTALITYADGSLASLVYTALGPKQGLPKERIEVFADGEAYVLDDFRTLTHASSGRTLWRDDAPDKGHQEEMRRLGEAIVTGAFEPIPFEEIVEATSVALHIEEQLSTKSCADSALGFFGDDPAQAVA